MKKLFVLVSAAIVAMVSCNKNANDTASIDQENSLERVPVVFGSNLKGVHLTKGGGALDSWDGNQDLFIFGLKRAADGSLDYADPFINNIGAKSPVGTQGEINLINPDIPAPDEDPTYTEPFYYGDKTDDNYDFFGYFVDDAVESEAGTPIVQLGENGYYVHAVIDGTQDLMVAVATAIKEDAEGPDVPANRLFSAYAARRGVHPNLVFKHKLSRIKFFLRSGTEEAYQKVSIASIAVESNTEADMLVASPGAELAALQNMENPDFLEMDFASSPITLPEKAAVDQDPIDKEVPGSILIMPGEDKYTLKLQLVQEGATTPEGNVRNLVIDFNKIIGGTDNKIAEPGYQYNVTVVVYGLEAVEVTVTLDEWHDGGSTVIDPDELDDEESNN